MGESSWSITTTGSVHADARDVLAWWSSPDRVTEYFDSIERAGRALDLTTDTTTEDGLPVRYVRYRDAKGWAYLHRLQGSLPTGTFPELCDDRYTVCTQDFETIDRGDQHLTVSCVAVREFHLVEAQRTQIKVVHRHTMTGGRWSWRRKRQRTDAVTLTRHFAESVQRCQAALRGYRSDPDRS